MQIQSWRAILEAKADIDGLIARAMIPGAASQSSPAELLDAAPAWPSSPASHPSEALTVMAGPSGFGGASPADLGLPPGGPPAGVIAGSLAAPGHPSDALTLMADPGVLGGAAPVGAPPAAVLPAQPASALMPSQHPSEMPTLMTPAVGAFDPSGAAGADVVDVDRLYWQVRQRIYHLRASIEHERAADSMMLPLVIFWDERVLRHLDGAARRSWPFVQKQWLDGCNGGQEFFRIADKTLADPASPVEMCEVLYFCLASGFVGEFAGSPQVVAGFAHRLGARIAPQQPLPAVRHGMPVAPHAKVRPAVYSYLAAAAALCLLVAGLVAFSNLA